MQYMPLAATGRNTSAQPNFGNASAANDQLEFLLASVRVARANLQTWQLELDMIGTALRGGHMSLDTACEWLDDLGLLHWLPDQPVIDAVANSEVTA